MPILVPNPIGANPTPPKPIPLLNLRDTSQYFGNLTPTGLTIQSTQST